MFIDLCLGSTTNTAILFPRAMGASALAVGVHGIVLISNGVTRSAIAKVKGLVTCKTLKMERRVEKHGLEETGVPGEAISMLEDKRILGGKGGRDLG